MSGRLLVIAHTASHKANAIAYLRDCGFDVRSVYDLDTAARILIEGGTTQKPDAILLDRGAQDPLVVDFLQRIAPPVYDGLIVLSGDPSLAASLPQGRVIIVPEQAGILALHQALQRGLSETAAMPPAYAPADISESLPGALAGGPLPDSAMEATQSTESFGGFIGTSQVMQSLYEQIQNAARSTATVFITGESGTGKDVCAQAIHKFSPRSERAYVPLNCAAIPRDLLESELFGHVRGAFTGAVSDRDGAVRAAEGGTLFLDEIGEMDPNMQTKLLRFLQDGTFLPVGGTKLEKVNVRIICATNRNPMADVRSGRFREDLFYRLHVLPIPMPPLRARGSDIIDIAQTLLLRYAAEEGKRFRTFAADAENALQRYPWPGNIRQLQNVIRQAVVMQDDGLMITAAMLPIEILHHGLYAHAANGNGGNISLGMLDGSQNRNGQAPMDAADNHGFQGGGAVTPLHILERRAIERAIARCAGNIPRAAALLEISPSTIYRKKAQWDDAIPPETTGPASDPGLQNPYK